jgi:uroporphyrinogen decarboxylase
MPMFLDWPVKDRATWKEYKKRLDPNTPERWPTDWNTWVQKMKDKRETTSSSKESYMPNQESSDWNSWVQERKSKSEPIMFKGITFANHPVSLQVGSFYGYLREMIGSERILYMFYDDPGLIEDMMEQMLYLETEIIKRVVKDIRIDQATFWEDMCYKAGPLISPAMVRKFMMPRYKKITDLLHSNGTDVIFVDSDGNVNELIPLWLEVGINFVWPLEVAAHNDAVALRKKYGKDLIISGTIDKRALIKGKEAIREEVMSKVPFLLDQGGYFPTIDHWVPPDVTFANYCYYINLMREVAGLERLSFQ